MKMSFCDVCGKPFDEKTEDSRMLWIAHGINEQDWWKQSKILGGHQKCIGPIAEELSKLLESHRTSFVVQVHSKSEESDASAG